MPATPAWPPKSAPRLFVAEPLHPGARVTLDGPQAHYLARVMRVSAGDPVVLCDDMSPANGPPASPRRASGGVALDSARSACGTAGARARHLALPGAAQEGPLRSRARKGDRTRRRARLPSGRHPPLRRRQAQPRPRARHRHRGRRAMRAHRPSPSSPRRRGSTALLAELARRTRALYLRRRARRRTRWPKRLPAPPSGPGRPA